MLRIFFTLLVSCVPLWSYANVSITEIMYDVSGSDAGHEWIEVRADTETDISDWKLFEADTNHRFTIVKGTVLIPAGGFAVIADNAEKFLLDFPAFSGTLFDSSFSLGNTGETIVLRDNTGTTTDSVSYAPSWGARGDGNSLQRDDTTWTYGIPTPGTMFIKKKEELIVPQKEEVVNIPSSIFPQEKRKDVQSKNETKEINSLVGAAIVSLEEETPAPMKETTGNSFTWWGALIFIALLSAGSVMWVRRKEEGTKEAENSELSADDFEIVDITEK